MVETSALKVHHAPASLNSRRVRSPLPKRCATERTAQADLICWRPGPALRRVGATFALIACWGRFWDVRRDEALD